MPTIAELPQSSTDVIGNEDSRVRKFVKSMLKGTLFVGTYMEKRYVEPINSYRDVIKLADDETQLIENLQAVKKRCRACFLQKIWIGYTDPKTIGAPAGHNLWVSLPQPTYGTYWYKIKSVEFHDHEICLKLEMVRSYTRERPSINSSLSSSSTKNESSYLSDSPKMAAEAIKENLRFFFSDILTLSNVKEAVIFLVLLISTLATFLVHTVKYLMEYFLKLLHETSGFVKACSPSVIALMRVIMQTINGFYTLIAIMWTNRKPVVQHQDSYQNRLAYETGYNSYNRALPDPRYYVNRHLPIQPRYSSSRSSVKITPLDD